MSLNLDCLNREFTPTDSPGLSTLDPRFQDIATMVQGGKYASAAEASQSVIEEDILDIRLIGYFFYGYFLENGPKGLAGIFDSLVRLVGAQWEAVGPAKKKDRLTGTTLVWFFKTLTRKVKMHEQKKDKTWTAWEGKTPPEAMDQAVEGAQKFRRLLSQAVEKPKGLDLLQNLVQWMKEFHQLVYRESQAKEAEAEAEKAAAEEAAKAEEEAASAAGQTAVATVVTGAIPAVPGGVLVEGGFKMLELKKKLDAFETLIERGQMAKASLVASDIGTVMNNFNPREYLPKFFSNYFALLARHITELAGFMEQKNSVSWGAMEQLYKVDLERFVEL